MFTKKPHIDIKKSIQKILDIKKDSFSRLRHLKQFLEYREFDAKEFFEQNYSHIYFIFFETISSLDNTFRQKGQKQSKEEQDISLFIFEKILIYLPELIHKGWQQHSIGFVLQRLIHHANSIYLRCEGIRLFLIWYQILNNNSKPNVHYMFASLVPGIVPEIPNPFISNSVLNNTQVSNSVNNSFDQNYSASLNETNENRKLSNSVQLFNQTNNYLNFPNFNFFTNSGLVNCNNMNGNIILNNNSVFASEIEPLLSSFSLEFMPTDATTYYLQVLLHLIVSQVNKIQWKENKKHMQKECFKFLFDSFNFIYLKNLFYDLDENFSFYDPNLTLPTLKTIYLEDKNNFNKKRFQHANTFLECRAKVIFWFAKFMKNENIGIVKKEQGTRSHFDQQRYPMFEQNVNSNFDLNKISKQSKNVILDPSPFEHNLVFNLLTSSKKYVNLVHQILSQTFYMPFSQADTIREVVSVYREWIYKNYNQVPIFLKEPIPDENFNDSNFEDVRAGLSAFYRIFITYSANVFLLKAVCNNLTFLDEQVEMCKRVLNIYRYMVMKVEMDKKTWIQLLIVVLKVTSLVLTQQVPIKKEETLGGRLAPAFFETLIVTWIKANLNIYVSIELWEQFQITLISLKSWSELIKEWSRTMDTLTRVMSRYVYNINLYDLPLERLTDRKNKRQNRVKQNNQVNFNLNLSTSNQNNTFDCKENSEQVTEVKKKFIKEDELKLEDKTKKNDFIFKNNKNYCMVTTSETFFRNSLSDTNLYVKNLENSNMNKLQNNKEFKKYIKNSISNYNENLNNKLKNKVQIGLRSKSLINLNYSNIIQSNLIDIEYNSEINSLSHIRSSSPISYSANLENNISNIDGLSITTNLSLGYNNLNNQNTNLNLKEINSSNLVQVDLLNNKSVIAGGNYKNWSPDSAIILWRRMLGILGDINDFGNPNLHLIAMECLSKIIEDFIKIRENLGIVLDSGQCYNKKNENYYPSLVPPLDYFVPWLFKATQLNDEYKNSKLIAFKLLCVITTRKHETLFDDNYFPIFYNVIHNEFNSYDLDIISIIIKYCGSKLFSFSLDGSSCLLYHFIKAAKLIINSNEIKGVPRFEALSLLGTLIGMSNVYKDIKFLQSNDLNINLIYDKNHKIFILELLMKAVKKEQTSLGRSVALNSISIYLYQELSELNEKLEPQISNIISLLIGCTKFSNKTLSRNACDMIRLQNDHADFILKKYPQIIKIIIEGLISSIQFHIVLSEKQNTFKDFQNLLLSLLLCLCDWCLSISKDYLKYTQSTIQPNECLLYSVIKLLNDLSNYNILNNNSPSNQSQNNTINKNTIEEESEIDYNIEIDNLNPQSGNTFKKSNVELNKSTKNLSFNSNSNVQSVDDKSVICMASSMLLNHLLNFVGHFPFPKLGPSRLSCFLNEFDDNPYLIKSNDNNELNFDLFNAPNIVFFIFNNSSIVSFIDLTKKSQISLKNNQNNDFIINDKNNLRIIVRDITGRFCWACTNLRSINLNSKNNFENVAKSIENNFASLNNCVQDDDINQNEEQRIDPLDSLLTYLNETFSEFTSAANSLQPNTAGRISSTSNGSFSINHLEQAEENMIALLVNQHYQEINYAEKLAESCLNYNLIKEKSNDYQKKIQNSNFLDFDIPTEFINCRQLFDQLGFFFWEKRCKIELLAKNERVLRELKNLDKQKCRETHKIAVIYVKEGQEDKFSILSNKCGSKEFEQFVNSLGWEVDLSKHSGFRGGLEDNLSTGKTAPYYSNAFYEVIFHVSTRISSYVENKKLNNSNETNKNNIDNSDKENINDILNKKLKHLGNDEIHIVWSEHYHNYRRNIIPTEFCDVLIVIYSINMYPGYYRVTIFCKNEIPFFGPLFNGAVVHISVLGGLVRATAINASRSQRSQVKFYEHFFQERNQCLKNIFKQHKQMEFFENFASVIYSPKQQIVSLNNFFSKNAENSLK